MRSDIPGLEKLPPIPKIETDIDKLIDKDRWKNSKMWKIGVSARRKAQYKEKIFKQVQDLEKAVKERTVDYEFKGVKRKPEAIRESISAQTVSETIPAKLTKESSIVPSCVALSGILVSALASQLYERGLDPRSEEFEVLSQSTTKSYK
ncbi:hypothetical protein AVEN_120480-1 [Araneus ventricosus]|uniref:Uncharacterized protein n=1 Tax=Araneus ventricosus TaxID=182803 RepID=A0A4Y2PY56_ARAVE|nr:hypothetical protein AVEN_120480-1 [Araneus ventricosus]